MVISCNAKNLKPLECLNWQSKKPHCLFPIVTFSKGNDSSTPGMPETYILSYPLTMNLKCQCHRFMQIIISFSISCFFYLLFIHFYFCSLFVVVIVVLILGMFLCLRGCHKIAILSLCLKSVTVLCGMLFPHLKQQAFLLHNRTTDYR